MAYGPPESSLDSVGGRRADSIVGVAGRGRWILFLSICCLGVSAFITQLTLMRELLSVFAGNELIFGIVLGNWLLLTGVGSALGKTASRLRRPVVVLISAQILVAVLPIADVFLVRALRNVVFIRGAEVGVTETVISCFVLLAPYCLTAGYLLTLSCLILASRRDAASIGQVYFLDNVGDVLGGILFSFILVNFLNHFGMLYVPAMLNLVFAALVAWLFRKRILLAITVVLTGALVGLILFANLDKTSTDIQYAGQHVVCRDNSPYGSLVVTESAGQYDFIENGVPLFSTHDVEAVEETVHYAMVQRPAARRVLLISGGVSGTAREILKYPVAAVDYVELDPMIIDVARQYANLAQNLNDRRIHLFNTDGRLFVKQTSQRYDVVIVDVPDPSTSQINRFYTREFFDEVKGVLNPDGVLAFSLGRYENYLRPELAKVVGVADRTLKQVFQNVQIIPGGRIFFLASDGKLSTDIAARLKRAGIVNRWVNGDYLRGVLTPDRMADIRRAISADLPVNEDFNPVLYYYHLRDWISQFGFRFGMLEGMLLLVLVVYLLRIRPVSLAIFTTGFAASALEVVLLVGFQILYGCVYHRVGLIVTMFMLGLGIGSFTMNRLLWRLGRRDLAKLEVAVAAYAVCVPAVLIGLDGLGGTAAAVASQVVVPLLAMILAVLVGMEFPLAGKAVLAAKDGGADQGPDSRAVTSTAARLYTADYVGAALGALLVSTLLIPLFGVIAVCLLAAGLNLTSGVVILVSSRR
jgi:spermidine synthase